MLRGCCPERRYFVIIPFNAEIVQLMMRRITPKTVPEIYPSFALLNPYISSAYQHRSNDNRNER